MQNAMAARVQLSGWLGQIEFGAGNEIRTRDLNLGKVALYQLSYSRVQFELQDGIVGELNTHFVAS